MARSFSDELLKAGLVTSEQASRAERERRSHPGPAKRKAKGSKSAENQSPGPSEKDRTRNASKQRPARSAPAKPAPPKPAPPNPEEQIRQVNIEIRRILDTEEENTEPETDTTFHFTRGERIKQLHVSEDQRKRLSTGELAIVSFRRRHHLVPRLAAERIQKLRPEVFVFIATGESGADAAQGYEGYEVPDDLKW